MLNKTTAFPPAKAGKIAPRDNPTYFSVYLTAAPAVKGILLPIVHGKN